MRLSDSNNVGTFDEKGVKKKNRYFLFFPHCISIMIIMYDEGFLFFIEKAITW